MTIKGITKSPQVFAANLAADNSLVPSFQPCLQRETMKTKSPPRKQKSQKKKSEMLSTLPEGGGGGGHSHNFWLGVCHWDSENLSLY